MISIPARIYSPMIWETIRYRTKEWPDDVSSVVMMEDAPGTVGIYTAFMLKRIARLLKPFTVAEIGTYIGRSMSALAEGMRTGDIYTCDSETNRCHAVQIEDVKIHLHPKTTSTQMFAMMKSQVDLFFFDGRIQPADVEHIQRLSKPDTIYLFDDFEGVEKGVANALMIQHLGGILVYPEQGQTLGMMIRKVGFTRQ